MREISPTIVYQNVMSPLPTRVHPVTASTQTRGLPTDKVLEGELLSTPRRASQQAAYQSTVYRQQAYEPVTTSMSLQEKRGVNAYVQQGEQQDQAKGLYVDDFA